jgi:hypothetical protein
MCSLFYQIVQLCSWNKKEAIHELVRKLMSLNTTNRPLFHAPIFLQFMEPSIKEYHKQKMLNYRQKLLFLKAQSQLV